MQDDLIKMGQSMLFQCFLLRHRQHPKPNPNKALFKKTQAFLGTAKESIAAG